MLLQNKCPLRKLSSSGIIHIPLLKLFVHVLLAERMGCLTHVFIERSIERLAVGKTYHCTDLLYGIVGIAFVCHQMFGIPNPVFIQQAGEIDSKARIDYSRQITCIGIQFLCQFHSSKVRITISFLQ